MSENVRKIFNIVVAIIVSIGAWTFVVYNNDPMTEVRYKDIPIVFQGEDALANQGYGVSQVSDKTIDVTLRQQRIDTADISAEDIRVIADVSSAVEGENGISLQISGPDNTQVAEASSRSISVEVEASDTVEKNVYVEYEEDIEGAEPVVTNLTSAQGTVIGAKSEVSRVDSVKALIAHSDTTDSPKKFTRTLCALDSDGDIIEHLVIYPKEVNFIAYAGEIKEVKLNVVTEDPEEVNKANERKAEENDEAAANGTDDEMEEDEGDGYKRTFTAPDTIVIKGAPDALSKVEAVSTELIDINSMYEDQEVELTYALPDGIYLANESKGKKIKVKVTRDDS